MDTEITAEVNLQRRKTALLYAVIAIAVIALGIWLIRFYLGSSVTREEITIANKVLRVANGPAFKGTSPQDVFVVKDNEATRHLVHTGLSNFDYVELQDGVKAGEVIITSDMSEYKNSKKLTIKE